MKCQGVHTLLRVYIFLIRFLIFKLSDVYICFQYECGMWYIEGERHSHFAGLHTASHFRFPPVQIFEHAHPLGRFQLLHCHGFISFSHRSVPNLSKENDVHCDNWLCPWMHQLRGSLRVWALQEKYHLRETRPSGHRILIVVQISSGSRIVETKRARNGWI